MESQSISFANYIRDIHTNLSKLHENKEKNFQAADTRRSAGIDDRNFEEDPNFGN